MKQGPRTGRRGRLHRHGKTKRKSLNQGRILSELRHEAQDKKYR